MLLFRMRDVKIVCRALITDAQNRLLFVKKAGSDFWILPGGTLNAEDTSVQACLVRELLEELGTPATVGDIRFVQELHKDGTRYVELIWEAALATDPVNIRNRISEIPEDEIVDIQWIRKSNLDDVNIKPEFLRDLVKAT